MDIELTCSAFREHRIENKLHVAIGGQMGLDYLLGREIYADRVLNPLPDLVLLDLKMPVVDGHEVLRQIKTAERLKRIPVVVLSSSIAESDRATSYGYGANSFLVKPMLFEDFVKIVKQIDDYWLTINVPPPA